MVPVSQHTTGHWTGSDVRCSWTRALRLVLHVPRQYAYLPTSTAGCFNGTDSPRSWPVWPQDLTSRQCGCGYSTMALHPSTQVGIQHPTWPRDLCADRDQASTSKHRHKRYRTPRRAKTMVNDPRVPLLTIIPVHSRSAWHCAASYEQERIGHSPIQTECKAKKQRRKACAT